LRFSLRTSDYSVRSIGRSIARLTMRAARNGESWHLTSGRRGASTGRSGNARNGVTRMSRMHTVIDSPIGELTLVALVGLYGAAPAKT
jgi:hypothetical protein